MILAMIPKTKKQIAAQRQYRDHILLKLRALAAAITASNKEAADASSSATEAASCLHLL